MERMARFDVVGVHILAVPAQLLPCRVFRHAYLEKRGEIVNLTKLQLLGDDVGFEIFCG